MLSLQFQELCTPLAVKQVKNFHSRLTCAPGTRNVTTSRAHISNKTRSCLKLKRTRTLLNNKYLVLASRMFFFSSFLRSYTNKTKKVRVNSIPFRFVCHPETFALKRRRERWMKDEKIKATEHYETWNWNFTAKMVLQ